MEELRKAILFDGILKTNFHDNELKRRLAKLPQLEFIPHFILEGDINYNGIFFLSNLTYWEKLDYMDWKKLLSSLSHKSIGIYSFFVITYKYLKIDMISFFKDLDTDYEDLKIASLKRFYENPHILQHDEEAKVLIDKYSLDRCSLIRIREKLLLQGALDAEIIKPRKKLQVGYSIIRPPISWNEWGEKLSQEETQ